jgi:hypothetical protein
MLKCIILILSISYFSNCNTNSTLELKKYESRGYLGPWRYIYYKSLYGKVHFPMLQLQLNQDSSFTARCCTVGYAGCFQMHNDTLCLLQYSFYQYNDPANIITRQDIISNYPLKLINKKSCLLDIIKKPEETLVWIIDK